MFKDVAFGQYYPSNSPVHRLDARVKLLLTLLFVISIFFIKTYFGFMLTLAVLLIVILLARLPIMSVLKSVRGILFIVVFTAVINLFFIKEGEVLVHSGIIMITKTGVHTTVKMVLRLVLLISGASLLSLTTTPAELADGLESLMAPLKLIKVPVRALPFPFTYFALEVSISFPSSRSSRRIARNSSRSSLATCMKAASSFSFMGT